MPTISMFYGIIIRMYDEQGGKHNIPHIHAEYSGKEAEIALDGSLLSGEIPANKLKMVQVWLDIHHDEVEANWTLLSSGERAYKIEPLK